MTARARLAGWLHALAYRIEPQAWYSRDPTLIQTTDGLGNVEFVRDLGGGTFDVGPRKPTPPPIRTDDILPKPISTPITRKRQIRAKAKP